MKFLTLLAFLLLVGCGGGEDLPERTPPKPCNALCKV
jgi:hypothetical protein